MLLGVMPTRVPVQGLGIDRLALEAGRAAGGVPGILRVCTLRCGPR
jgi:hypothetical protein